MTRTEREVRNAYETLVDDDAHLRLCNFIDELAVAPVTRSRPWSRGRRLWAPIAVVGLTAISAVLITVSKERAGTPTAATSSSPSNTAPGSRSDPRDALRQWATFPVTARNRPIVLTGDAVQSPAGFRTDRDKRAFLDSNFVLATSLPTSPARSRGFPITRAAEALSELRGQYPATVSTTPERIIKAQLTTNDFSTDRGMRSLPAWAFTLAGGTTPAYVLAIQPSERWPKTTSTTTATGNDPTTQSVTIGGDDRQLTLHFFAGARPGTGPCEANYETRTTQSTTAIVIQIKQIPATPIPTAVATCTADLHARTIVATIDRPVGNRVLIDATGAPLPQKSQ